MFGRGKRKSNKASSRAAERPGAAKDPLGLGPDDRIGRYTIVEPAGQGAMGRVYLARDPVIGRQVAIKVITLRPDLSEEQASQFRERFLREAQAAGALVHPNIVSVHDIGQDPTLGHPYIVMEHVKGWDLGKLIDERAPLPGRSAVRIVMQIAAGLDFAHRRGIVHRDVKPANVLIGERGQVKIADFGVARLPGSDLTRVDQFVGSPAYMSPEQLKGANVDGRADLFALGVILYQLLTGRIPFDGESVSEVLYRVANHTAEPPSAIVKDISREFDAILERALSKDPDRRYQTGREMMADLMALSAVEPDEGDRTQPIATRVAVPSAAPGASQAPAGRSPGRRRSAPWWDLESSWRLGSFAVLMVLIYILVNWAFHALLRGPLGQREPVGTGSAVTAPLAGGDGAEAG